MKLKDKVALITGDGRDIGKAVASVFVSLAGDEAERITGTTLGSSGEPHPLQPQELLNPRLVEANHSFAINQRHRCALIPHGQELL